MKNILKITSLILCANLLMLLSGCGKKSETDEETSSSGKKDYDIYIYNRDENIGSDFREMCDEYTKRTGIIIRTVTPSESENNFENLKNYLNSEHPPDIFTVESISELNLLKNNSQIWDFSNATEESFKNMVNSIPEQLRLSSNTTDNFGVPYTVEGYGFLVDPKMIASIFGGDKYRKVISDLQVCSYEEFLNFVEAIKGYINGVGGYEISINKHKYTCSYNKGELGKNLNGVFSFAAGNSKYSGSYLSNIALSTIFKSPAAANIATDENIQNLKNPLMKFAEALDYITLNMSGPSGSLERGLEMVSNTQNSVSQSLKNFVNGKALFLLASTEDYESLSVFNSLVAKRSVFIPIKMPFSQDEITSSQDIAKNINKSITAYVPRYYCINAQSGETEKQKAQDFLTWIRTSELAQKYVIPKFGFTPYDIKDSSVVDNPLSRSLLEYISEGKIISGAFLGAPEKWCNDGMGRYLIERYFTKSSWNYDDYESIADYGIEKWKELE